MGAGLGWHSFTIGGGLSKLPIIPAGMVFARHGFCEISTSVMGTDLVIKAWGKMARRAAVQAFGEVRRIEGLMSVFRRSSDIFRLNRYAGISPVRVGADTMRVLEYAVEVSNMSHGAFDITAGPIISLWRKSIAGAVLPCPSELDEAMKLVGISSLRLQSGMQSSARQGGKPGARVIARLGSYLGAQSGMRRGLYQAHLCRRGQSVDLGGIAKGYAADKAIEVFKKFNLDSALMDIGGNVAVYGFREDGESWSIGIQSPDGGRGEALGIVKVVDRAVVTSGDYEQSFKINGRRYHHIIDPRTGFPARSGLRSVTVVANRGLIADAVSTAALVLGLTEGARLIEKTGVDAIFVADGGDIYVTKGLARSFLQVAGGTVRLLD